MTRMIDYGFVENVDYMVIVKNDENSKGGRPKYEHALKIDMAKEISMIQRNDKDKQARQKLNSNLGWGVFRVSSVGLRFQSVTIQPTQK